MRSLWQRLVHWPYVWLAAGVVVLVIAVVPALVVASRLARTRSEIWQADDWAALWVTLSSAGLFSLLAVVIGARGQQRGRALADAELSRTVGALAASGSRSFAGDETQALRVPSDALGALKHYQAAGPTEQERLSSAIRRAFADIVFATACKADALPRSIWDRLCVGMEDLSCELRLCIKEEPSPKLKAELRATLSLVDLTHELGMLLRRNSWKLSRGQSMDLSTCLDARGADAEDSRVTSADDRLRVLERLYDEELTVIKDWRVFRRNSGEGEAAQVKAEVAVRLEDVMNGEEWYSPWYVSTEPTDGDSAGAMRPVNVNESDLNEASLLDRPKGGSPVPEWPTPLLHRQLPEGLRERGIERAKELLQCQGTPVTVCVLLYEFADVYRDDQRARLVLDGNHRLAGALRWARELPPDEREACQIRVLAFVITEREPIHSPATDNRRGWDWHGFTPDVENIRFKTGDLDDLRYRGDPDRRTSSATAV